MYKRAKNKDALLDIWNSEPSFVQGLLETNVYPTFESLNDPTLIKWERNPRNRGKFAIVGGRLDINE